MHRTYRDLKRAVESEGAVVEYIGSPNGKHIHIVVAHGDRIHTFIASKTPSCAHALKNFTGDVRRWIRSVA